ncbi:Membrane protein involved in the export of O-antigen and teichoic acid [Rhizobiales bacterium GAS188]|nr:Membrane protein involved in the export of O-antigen and teichoic acid [Rhizobiales bacterium GAS188]
MWTGALFALNALLNLGLALALAWALPAAAYGAFTVYFAAALLIGNLSYDWVRFSAMRFYTPLARSAEPALRATLDLSLFASTGLMVALAAVIAATDALPEVSLASVVGLIAVTSSNAAFEYWTALCRARFDARRYAVMVIARNLMTFGLTVPVAALTGSFTAAMFAFAAAVVPSILYGVVTLDDKQARSCLATRLQAMHFARYATPLVLAEGCYLVIAVVNRTFLAHGASLAEAGAYALTFDLAFRALAVTASVGDAVLFPRLVANLHAQGAARTREEVARNIAVMLLVLAPAAAGYALIAEPMAQLLLAEHFRDAFARYSPIAVMAAFAYTVQTFVLRPAFQVQLRTGDMPLAAVAAVLVDLAMLALLPADGLLAASCAHLAGLSVGLILVLRRAIVARLVDWPLRDIGKIAASVAALVACVAMLRFEGHPLLTLAARAVCGILVYGAAAWLFDAAGLRGLLRRGGAGAAPG